MDDIKKNNESHKGRRFLIGWLVGLSLSTFFGVLFFALAGGVIPLICGLAMGIIFIGPIFGAMNVSFEGNTSSSGSFPHYSSDEDKERLRIMSQRQAERQARRLREVSGRWWIANRMG